MNFQKLIYLGCVIAIPGLVMGGGLEVRCDTMFAVMRNDSVMRVTYKLKPDDQYPRGLMSEFNYNATVNLWDKADFFYTKIVKEYDVISSEDLRKVYCERFVKVAELAASIAPDSSKVVLASMHPAKGTTPEIIRVAFEVNPPIAGFPEGITADFYPSAHSPDGTYDELVREYGVIEGADERNAFCDKFRETVANVLQDAIKKTRSWDNKMFFMETNAFCDTIKTTVSNVIRTAVTTTRSYNARLLRMVSRYGNGAGMMPLIFKGLDNSEIRTVVDGKDYVGRWEFYFQLNGVRATLMRTENELRFEVHYKDKRAPVHISPVHISETGGVETDGMIVTQLGEYE